MKEILFIIGVILLVSSCKKQQFSPDKNCKKCENQIQFNDSIFNTIDIDTSWSQNKVWGVKIEDDCFIPSLDFLACYLKCSDYTYYAKYNLDSNFYEIKWFTFNDWHCEVLSYGGIDLPINISSLQDSTKNEVYLKLYNYDKLIRYAY